MIRVIEERDHLIEQIKVVQSDGTPHTLDVLVQQKLLHNSFDGTSSWAHGMTWYRCRGIEVTLQDDGTWVSDESPSLEFRRLG
ncbi:MAG: hypothetical protein ACOVN9_13190 [Inhella sp.]